MLDQISWGQFALVIGVALLVYYAVLMFLQLKNKLLNTARNPDRQKRIWQVEEQQPAVAMEAVGEASYVEQSQEDEDAAAGETLSDDEEQAAFESLEKLAEAIENIITETQAGIEKEILLDSLQQEIARYPLLTGFTFRTAIVRHIIRTAQAEKNMEISREEAFALWVDKD